MEGSANARLASLRLVLVSRATLAGFEARVGFADDVDAAAAAHDLAIAAAVFGFIQG